MTADRLDTLMHIYRGDVVAVRRRLESDARLTLLRFRPAPSRPPTMGEFSANVIGQHIDVLIAAKVITADGRRTAKDEHGRVIFQDPKTGEWYRIERGLKIYLTDDD